VSLAEGTRQNSPVTSEEGVPGVTGDLLPEAHWAAVNGVKRLFTKTHLSAKPMRRRIGSDTCPVPEG